MTRFRFGRRQTLGVIFGFVGLFLVGYVAPNLDPADKGLTLEPPPDPVKLVVDPPITVTTIGIVFVLIAVATFLERRSVRLASGALILGSALFIPLVLVLALAQSGSQETNVMQLLVESLRLGTPIALGAMAGLWCERSGVVNIGIEGMMLASACTGFMAYAIVGDANTTSALWFGIFIAVLTGGLLALLHATLSVTFRVDQIISGVVINLLALGLTGFLRSEVLVDTGVSAGVPTGTIALPLLSRIPIVGDQLFTNKPIFFAMLVIVAGTAWVLFRTAFGLRVRSVGENPHAAETLGIDPIRIRYKAVVIGGLVAGLAGAWFSMESQGGFQDNMTNGAGFIALAALIFGKWRPFSAFAGAMLFGFTRALGSRLQILNVTIGDFSIPSEFLQSLPYVVTIIVVAGAVGRAMAPAADGVPYERSR
ncbi:MAG: ABC transporter permease [Acidimicrobiales bacterium]